MSRIEHLEGKTVAIIGLGVSQVDFAIGLENSREWDEVWCINFEVSPIPDADYTVELHYLHKPQWIVTGKHPSL